MIPDKSRNSIVSQASINVSFVKIWPLQEQELHRKENTNLYFTDMQGIKQNEIFSIQEPAGSLFQTSLSLRSNNPTEVQIMPGKDYT